MSIVKGVFTKTILHKSTKQQAAQVKSREQECKKLHSLTSSYTGKHLLTKLVHVLKAIEIDTQALFTFPTMVQSLFT